MSDTISWIAQMALIMTMIILFRYNTGEMNFLCPGMTAKDCVVDSKGRNSCDGPCKLFRLKDRKTMLFCGLIKNLKEGIHVTDHVSFLD